MIEADTLLQNRYRVRKQIGQGGMGAVYIATDERFGSTVAIKETLFADDNYRRAFEREARLLNSLRHPALPTVGDHFVEGNGQFIVMEYIAGEDLAEQLAKNGKPFPLKDVLIWADQLLDALEFLHNQEIPVIHRDIKPQNLKLTSRNQIILLDFGLAKGNPTDLSHHTAAKSIFGYSPGYASLEQIQGTGTEPRSDLYSLAATLYHLLTGAPPTDALTRAMSVLNERDDPLRPAHSVNPQIPFGVSEVLRQAMALNANHRPSSAAEMRRLLDESDKIENTADYETVSGRVLPTNIFTQNTKLFAEQKTPQAEIKTEVFESNDAAFGKSRETVLADKAARDTVSGRANRRYVIGAAVFGVLLLLGFGMFALSDAENRPPGSVSRDKNVSDSSLSNINVIVTETNAGLTEANQTAEQSSEEINSNSLATGLSAQKETEKPESTPQKPGVTTRNPTKNTKAPVASKEPFIIHDDEEGNVKIYEDKIETDEVIVESNKIRIKKPGKSEIIRPLSPQEMRRLPPEQRRKLFKLRQMQKNMPKPPNPPPAGYPTPEN